MLRECVFRVTMPGGLMLVGMCILCKIVLFTLLEPLFLRREERLDIFHALLYFYSHGIVWREGAVELEDCWEQRD